METKYAAHRRQRQRIKHFVRTNVEQAKRQSGEIKNGTHAVVLHKPAVLNNPPVTGPAENSRLPLFTEPLFKAKEFDPL